MQVRRRPRRAHALAALLIAPWLLAACASAGNGTSAAIVVDGSGPAGNYLAGLHALRSGQYRLASELLGRALEADPDNLELRRQIFRLHVANGDRERAVEEAQELLDLGADLAMARLLLAVDAAGAGDFATARRHLARIGSRGAAGLAAPLLDAWALFALEGKDAAFARLEQEETSEGLDRLYAYHRAMMHALGGDIDAARRLVSEQLPPDRPAPTRLVHAAAYILDRAGARQEALQLVRHQLRFVPENALLRWLEAALRTDAQVPPPFDDAAGGMAEALDGLARALADQNIDEESLSFARLATFLRPDFADAWLLIARLALARDDTEAAIDALGRVPADSPLAWEARLLQANALVDAGRREDAIRLLRAMAKERPDRIEPLIALGDLYRRERQYAEAEKAYAEAIRRVPELTPAHWRLLYVHGITLERTGRWPEAEQRFLQALEFQPDQPFVLNYLGYSWVEKGLNLDRAKEMLHKAVELRPRDGFIVDSLGWAYYQLGEYDRAVEYLERAVELEPGDPVINDHLGDAYWRVGRRREARFQWERALSLQPERDLVAAIEDKLRNGLPDDATDRG